LQSCLDGMVGEVLEDLGLITHGGIIVFKVSHCGRESHLGVAEGELVRFEVGDLSRDMILPEFSYLLMQMNPAYKKSCKSSNCIPVINLPVVSISPPLHNVEHAHADHNLSSSNRSAQSAPSHLPPRNVLPVTTSPLLLGQNQAVHSHDSPLSSKRARSSSIVPKVASAVKRVKLEVEENSGIITCTILLVEPYEYVEMTTEAKTPLLDLTGED
ncbi:hypothetical protein KI387_001978, partial [Taxus chinensis]